MKCYLTIPILPIRSQSDMFKAILLLPVYLRTWNTMENLSYTTNKLLILFKDLQPVTNIKNYYGLKAYKQTDTITKLNQFSSKIS